ncbi:unnamed protein product [Oikopleura dioica]|uniref:ODAD1 central coiled coil region domain-containing protein n=1 Tax=Oikopleura dioica TaxID=34765 RepID=E4WRV7_OIKDI|nr:unnamed protein product [Oikopleura dioica]
MNRSKSARSAYSDDSRDEGDDSTKQELAKIQQSLRIIEGEKKRSQNKFKLDSRKDKKKIDLLFQEHAELEKNINLAQSQQNRIRDNANEFEIRETQLKVDKLDTEMEEERRIGAELDAQIRGNQKSTQNTRVRSATLSQKAARGAHSTRDQKVNDIEGRLYRANAKYNQTVAFNAKKRTEIQTLRLEHRNFEQAERKIDKKLKTVKKNTQQIMEASSIAYEQREDAKTKHANQRERSEKELSQYNSDIKQLERLNENHFNLKVFMENKNQERTEVNTGPSQRTLQKRKDQETMLLKCEHNLDQIKEITGTDDISVMVKQFNETERENFALFNYNNELNINIEHESDAIAALQARFTSQSTTSLINDDERNEKLTGTQTSLEESENLKADGLRDLQSSNDEFEMLIKGITQLSEQLSLEVSIEHNNDLMDVLGAVEDRINELIAAKAVIVEQLDPDVNHTARLLVPGPPPLPIEERSALFSAPSTGDLAKKLRKNKFLQLVQGDAATNEQKEQAIESSVPLDLNELRQRVREKREREASALNPESSQKFDHSEKPVTSESTRLSREPSVVTSQPPKELEEA